VSRPLVQTVPARGITRIIRAGWLAAYARLIGLRHDCPGWRSLLASGEGKLNVVIVLATAMVAWMPGSVAR
jgi:hypothetical protein